MLPKQNRLPGYLIPHLLNSQTTHHSPLFVLKTTSSSNPFPRIGFIVSTKIANLAVDRNRLKRLLRAATYPHLKNLKPQHDLLILAKHPLKQKSLTQIQPHLLSLLTKTKLLNEKPRS